MRTALKLLVYIFLYLAAAYVFGPLFAWIGGYLVGITLTGFAAAAVSNALCMRIYEHRTLLDIGLQWNRVSARNLGWGLACGIGSASLVLCAPLLAGVAHFRAVSENQGSAGAFVFVMVMLAFGAAGEEMLFRGFGFQVLVRTIGPFTTILPVGIVFAALHASNPNSSNLGLINTAGFGILFGFAFLRSRDLWLPIGLHFGWNITLPLFGVSVSGITMGVTGYALEWSAGPFWSGGAYGPEASILTSLVLAALAVVIWKAPIQQNYAPLLERRDSVENSNAHVLFPPAANHHDGVSGTSSGRRQTDV